MNRSVAVSCWGFLALVPVTLAPVTLAPLTLAQAASGSPSAAVGHVTFVQAVPGAEVAISVDDETVEPDASTGDVVGPVDLDAGKHLVLFEGDGVSVSSTIEVSARSSQDVVIHSPASVDAGPVVSSYPTPLDPIGPDKSRVLVAHTATVAPADVRVDGQVVFTNIANGEYATADVPAGDHEVALLPTGTTADPILGPLTVTVQPRTLTMVYAIGNPDEESMDLVAHATALPADGSQAPGTIDTGSAGLVAQWRVRAFGSPPGGS